MPRICVYAGSSFGSASEYSSAAAAFGTACAKRGLGIVYGGGRAGLMGVLADAALAAGGEVIGIIPHALLTAERAHSRLTQLIPVETMHERKYQMVQMADSFAALPGGIGTLDEIVEVFSWLQLGLHLKPVGLLNVNSYYDPLVKLFDHMCEERFVTPAHRNMLIVETQIEALLDRLDSTKYSHIVKPVHLAAAK
jgi:uncharacterized protein (TIGR00730 family)